MLRQQIMINITSFWHTNSPLSSHLLHINHNLSIRFSSNMLLNLLCKLWSKSWYSFQIVHNSSIVLANDETRHTCLQSADTYNRYRRNLQCISIMNIYDRFIPVCSFAHTLNLYTRTAIEKKERLDHVKRR